MYAERRVFSALELEILRCIAMGLQSKEIATHVNRSRPTVEAYVRLMCARCGAKSRANLVAIALASGILSPLSIIGDRQLANAGSLVGAGQR